MSNYRPVGIQALTIGRITVSDDRVDGEAEITIADSDGESESYVYLNRQQAFELIAWMQTFFAAVDAQSREGGAP